MHALPRIFGAYSHSPDPSYVFSLRQPGKQPTSENHSFSGARSISESSSHLGYRTRFATVQYAIYSTNLRHAANKILSCSRKLGCGFTSVTHKIGDECTSAYPFQPRHTHMYVQPGRFRLLYVSLELGWLRLHTASSALELPPCTTASLVHRGRRSGALNPVWWVGEPYGDRDQDLSLSTIPIMYVFMYAGSAVRDTRIILWTSSTTSLE